MGEGARRIEEMIMIWRQAHLPKGLGLQVAMTGVFKHVPLVSIAADIISGGRWVNQLSEGRARPMGSGTMEQGGQEVEGPSVGIASRQGWPGRRGGGDQGVGDMWRC